MFWIRSLVGIGCLHAATLNLHRQLGLKIIKFFWGAKDFWVRQAWKTSAGKNPREIFVECRGLMTSDQK